jgi:hypothetical protein
MRFGCREDDLHEKPGAWGDVPSTTDRDESRPWTGRPGARTRSPGITTLVAGRLFYAFMERPEPKGECLN